MKLIKICHINNLFDDLKRILSSVMIKLNEFLHFLAFMMKLIFKLTFKLIMFFWKSLILFELKSFSQTN